MSAPARPRVGALLAGFAALVAAIPAGPVPVRVVAVAVTWTLTPGLLLAGRLARDGGRAWRVALALGVSPLLAGGPVAALAGAGLPLAAAARLTAGAIAAWAVIEFLRPARAGGATAGERAAPGPGEGGAATWALAGAGAALLLGLHLARPALGLRSDGSFHAAVVLSALRSGVPPEDPFFAGLRLLYFWGAHVWSAGWLALAPGLAPTTPLLALMAASTGAGLLAVGLLAARLGGGAGTIALAGGLAMFGSAPFAWLALAARTPVGPLRGLEEAHRLLTHGVDPALAALSRGLLHPSLVLTADKFVVVTPFALGIALSVLLTLALLETIGRPGPRRAAVLAVVTAAALFVHPVAAAAMLAAGAPAWLLLLDRGLEDADARRAAAGVAIGATAGVAVVAPYLLAIQAGHADAGSAEAPAAGARALWSLVAGGALIVPPAAWWLLRGRGRDGDRSALLAIAAVLATGALLFELRGDNESKLLNLLFFLLAPAAALGWREAFRRGGPLRRAALPALLAAAALPTLLCCAVAYLHERPDSADSPADPGGAARALLAQVPRLAAPRAVLVDGTLDTTRAVAPPAPRLAGRPLLWGGRFLAAKWGYPPAELAARREAAQRLASGEPAAAADSLVRAMGRETWVLGPAPDPAAGRFAAPRWQPVRAGGGLALYRYRAEGR